MASVDALVIDPAGCDPVVRSWRTAADYAQSLTAMTSRWTAEYELDQPPGLTTALTEIVEELALAATILSGAAAQARRADGFDGSSVSGLRWASVALERSLNDRHGAMVRDLHDPTPADGDAATTVHLGYLPLFGPNGPRLTDAQQGLLNDCTWLAGFAGLAALDPAQIEAMITDNRDGTYTVRFPDGDVTVDDEFFVREDGVVIYAQPAAGVLWPLVLEKALAAYKGGSYATLDSGAYGYEPFNDAFGVPAQEVDLNPPLRRDPSDTEVIETITAAAAAGGPILALSNGPFGNGGHAFTVVGVQRVDTNDDGDDDTDCVVIRDPHGPYSVLDDADAFANNTDRAAIEAATAASEHHNTTGVWAIPIEVFTDNFDFVYIEK
jgi:hypothetical protein